MIYLSPHPPPGLELHLYLAFCRGSWYLNSVLNAHTASTGPTELYTSSSWLHFLDATWNTNIESYFFFSYGVFSFLFFFHIGSHVAQPNPELLVLLPLTLKGWDHSYVLPCLALYLFLMSYLGSEQTYSLNTQLPHFIYYQSPLTSNIQRTETACLWGDCNF